MKKKILIIGGCGFIGHNLSLFLKGKGYLVNIVDNLGVNNLKSINYNKVLYNNVFHNSKFLLLK